MWQQNINLFIQNQTLSQFAQKHNKKKPASAFLFDLVDLDNAVELKTAQNSIKKLWKTQQKINVYLIQHLVFLIKISTSTCFWMFNADTNLMKILILLSDLTITAGSNKTLDLFLSSQDSNRCCYCNLQLPRKAQNVKSFIQASLRNQYILQRCLHGPMWGSVYSQQQWQPDH